MQLDTIELTTGENPQRSVIWLHGLGADGHDFAPIVPELPLANTPDIRFVFPHAPVRPIHINGGMAMRAWYDIKQIDLSRQEDETGIRQSQSQIEQLIENEIQRGIPAKHIVLAGFSQGCAMALHTGLRYQQSLAGIIGLSGYLPLLDYFQTERSPANANTPIFIAHGSMDPVVPIDRGHRSYQLLKEHAYPVTWHEYPMPHSVVMEEINDIGFFLQTVLSY